MERIEVVVAHSERTTLRVGDTFLKVDADVGRGDREAAAIALAPIPAPRVLWRKAPVLALAAVPGVALGRLGEPSPVSPAAWRAAGAAARTLHQTAPPDWSGTSLVGIAARLDEECAWLHENAVLPADLIDRNRRIAELALEPREPVFMHGDLQPTHVFVIGDGEISGVIDWSEAGLGDPLFDLATVTLGHPEHLDDVLDGYGRPVDVDALRAWWSVRGLTAARWLIQHGFDPSAPGGEFDVLRAQL